MLLPQLLPRLLPSLQRRFTEDRLIPLPMLWPPFLQPATTALVASRSMERLPVSAVVVHGHLTGNQRVLSGYPLGTGRVLYCVMHLLVARRASTSCHG